MEDSPRYRDATTNLIPSPRCHNITMSSTTESNKPPTTPTRHVTTRSEPGTPYPTTFVQADTSSFKQVVQMLTGSSDRPKQQHNPSSLKPNPTHQPDPRLTPSQFSIPPIKAVPNKKHSSSSSSGFRLYERRNSMKNLKLNPLNPVLNPVNSTRKPEILSPSILDFPSLVLSPVTPLIPDPFDRSGSSGQSPDDAEEKAMKEKGFYLHPSPVTTPMDQEPRLLPLFPVTSRVSGSSTAASTS